MRKMNRAFPLTLALLAVRLWGAPARAAELLQGDPVVRKTETGVEIALTARAPTDLTVRILDGQGRAIRHLASGMVGLARAAEPLSPASLSQTIAWDGKDDSGKPVDPAGAKVWVGAGLGAAFDRFILWEPDGIGLGPRDKPDHAILPAPKGEFHVTQTWGVHMATTRVFDAQGRLRRGLWPFALGQAPDRIVPFLRGRDGADDWDGRRVPLCVNHNAFYYFGTSYADAVVATDGTLVGVTGLCMDYISLIRVTPEGLPSAQGWTPAWHKTRTFARDQWKLAAGPEGDFYLADRLHHVVGHFRARDFEPIPFARSGAKEADPLRPYLGEIGQPGDDAGHFTGPDGIALDPQGRLLVADGEAVKVYERTGAFVEKRPREKAAASPVPEALLAAMKKARALTFPHLLRVDSQGRFYVANNGKGAPFVVTDVDGKAFEPRTLPWGHSTAQAYNCVDAADNWYLSVTPPGRERADEVWKFSPDGKRLKLGEKDALAIDFGERAEIKGICVAANGDVYVVAALSKWKTPPAMERLYGNMELRGDDYNLTRVDVFGPDGTLKHKGLVRSQGLNDVAVDREGNIYVIESTMWHGAHMMRIARSDPHGKWPKAFPFLSPDQQKLGTDSASKRLSLMARLLKFPPTGGALDGQGGPGQLWGHAGVSGLSPWNCGSECPAGQLCLDPDQRLWAPDTFLYNLKALDRAGNLILRVGTYGSEDCKGGGGDKVLEGTRVVVDPEIPLARPSGMAVYGDWLFVSDMFAHRVMRCKLTFADAREVAVPR